jgi:predicted amidohydrolase YtcJ
MLNSPRDTILRDATILTMDDRRSIVPGLWIRGDRIAGAGDPAWLAAQAGPDARVVSLGGATVVPGFNDVHCHISGYAYSLMGVDVSQPRCPDFASIKAALVDQAARTPPGVWVSGWGYVEYKLREHHHPTRWDLDKVIGDRPAVIYHTSGHVSVVNSEGLAAAGYRDDSPDPPGGQLGRDEHGVANGVLYNFANFRLLDENYDRDLRAMTTTGRAKMLERAAREYSALGITSLSDAAGYATNITFRMFRDAEAEGRLALRIAAMFNEKVGDCLIDAGMTTGFGSEWLQVGAIKVFGDGGMSSRTAAVEEPYLTEPHDHGTLFFERDDLAAVIRKYHEAGFQVAIHAQGDVGIRTALGAYEDVLGRGSGNRMRHRIEHGGCLYPHLLKQAAEVGIHVASEPAYLSVLGDGYFEAFGDDSAQMLYPFASIRKAGLVVGGSSDAPVVTADPLVGIRDAVVRRTEGGRSIGSSEKLAPIEALELYTRDAAWLSHHERTKGSLEPGKLADYVVLAENPLEVEPERIAEVRVLRTVVGGETMYEA